MGLCNIFHDERSLSEVEDHHTGIKNMQKPPLFRINILCHWLEVITWGKSYDEANAFYDHSPSEVGCHHTGLNNMQKPTSFMMNALHQRLEVITQDLII